MQNQELPKIFGIKGIIRNRTELPGILLGIIRITGILLGIIGITGIWKNQVRNLGISHIYSLIPNHVEGNVEYRTPRVKATNTELPRYQSTDGL